MTNQRPSMPLYIDDYDGDTRHLTAAQDGVYGRLLRAMWRAGGSLPADEKSLCLIARISGKQWRSMAAAILAFFTIVDGRIEQKRLKAELSKVGKVSEVRAVAGRKGVEAKQRSQKELNIDSPREHSSPAKPLKNGHDGEANGQANTQANAKQTANLSLFPDKEIPPTPPKEINPSPRVSVSRARRPKDGPAREIWDALATVLSPDAVQAVIDHRRTTIKKPLTPRAAELLAANLADVSNQLGMTPDQAADVMISRGWQGLKAEWLKAEANAGPRGGTSFRSTGPPKMTFDEEMQEFIEKERAKERRAK